MLPYFSLLEFNEDGTLLTSKNIRDVEPNPSRFKRSNNGRGGMVWDVSSGECKPLLIAVDKA